MLKIVIAVLSILLAAHVILVFIGAAILSLTFASCVASCSDSPTHDSRANSSFIHAMDANERDLTTFDALRGSIEYLHDHRTYYNPDGGEEPTIMSVDDLRAQVAAGTWPDSSSGYNDADSSNSPQLWVRIAELSQDFIEKETGERWDVVDFSYPFPDNGPIPVPATRDETSHITTLLVCTSGEDAGLYATVDYWRWENPARFEEHVQEARDQHDEELALRERIAGLDAMAGRRFTIKGSSLDIWQLGEDDPLCDPETFVAFVNDLTSIIDGYVRVTLLNEDTPTILSYSPLSYDYPNNRPLQEVSYETCRETLALCGSAFSLDYASSDTLLSAWRSDSHIATTDELSGSLAPVQSDDYLSRFYSPDEYAVADEALGEAMLKDLQNVGLEQLIAISQVETSGYGDVTLRTWTIVPRGAMPEDPKGFCTAVNALREDVWAVKTTASTDDKRDSLYCRVYVIDEESIKLGEDPKTFAELRDAALHDASSLEGWTFDVLLATQTYMTLWSPDEEPSTYDCEPRDVGGIIARSREWRYGEQ